MLIKEIDEQFDELDEYADETDHKRVTKETKNLGRRVFDICHEIVPRYWAVYPIEEGLALQSTVRRKLEGGGFEHGPCVLIEVGTFGSLDEKTDGLYVMSTGVGTRKGLDDFYLKIDSSFEEKLRKFLQEMKQSMPVWAKHNNDN